MFCCKGVRNCQPSCLKLICCIKSIRCLIYTDVNCIVSWNYLNSGLKAPDIHTETGVHSHNIRTDIHCIFITTLWLKLHRPWHKMFCVIWDVWRSMLGRNPVIVNRNFPLLSISKYYPRFNTIKIIIKWILTFLIVLYFETLGKTVIN